MSDRNQYSQKQLIERLKATPFYQACQNAFRDGTGLPLVLQCAQNPEFNPCLASKNQNLFCQQINSTTGPCAACQLEQQKLFAQSSDQAHTNTCFAGLKETAVPLKLGHTTIGFLKTGQVYTSPPSAEQRLLVARILHNSSHSDVQVKRLSSLHTSSPLYDPLKYSSTITLLSIISLQLTEFLNRLLLETNENEPDIVRKAKSIIAEHIDKKLTLEEVSNEVHVSVHHFCKIFKQSTGMTFTEYVNRQRVELAKNELKLTDKPVTEIAFAVGFQSLSHFNRCFLKFAGESPRQYRDNTHHTSSSLLVS